MNGKKLLIAGTIAAISVSGYATSYASYTSWRRRELNRLQEESTLIETRLGTVEYHISGSASGPVVLILHGSPGGYDMGVAFSQLIDSPGFTYIAVSRPGYLRTPLASGKTPAEQADLYAALLDQLNIRQASIIGVSGGGPSALQFALRHPERCSQLVMISGVARRYNEDEIKQAGPAIKRIFRRVYDRIVCFEPLLYLALPLARLQPTRPGSDGLLRSVTMYDLRKQGYANDMEQFIHIFDYPLEKIAAPTLAVHGMADDEVPFADAQLLARKIPIIRLLAIPGAGHLVFYTHASLVMTSLREFLQAERAEGA
ncbi:MAG: alpha/beta hydrolase [Ktedonobacteraceae bacterium]